MLKRVAPAYSDGEPTAFWCFFDLRSSIPEVPAVRLVELPTYTGSPTGAGAQKLPTYFWGWRCVYASGFLGWRRNVPGKEKQKAEKKKAQHRAFPRGPPPQYYPGSNLLNFAVRMGSGEPG